VSGKSAPYLLQVFCITGNADMSISINRSTVLAAIFLALLMSDPLYALERPSSGVATQAVGFSGGWISGNGITYRRYFGNHFLQGTAVALISNNANDTYVNAAFSAGTYLHRLEASGIVPPLGLKVMAGADMVLERRSSNEAKASPGGSTVSSVSAYDKSYYGGGIGLDIGNPGQAGLSFWLAVNYVFAYDSITSPKFEWFATRPAAGILYGW